MMRLYFRGAAATNTNIAALTGETNSSCLANKKARADHGGQLLKFALNPAVLLGKIAKFIVFVPIFLYNNMITVKKIIIVTQPFPAFYALIGEPPENERKLL